MPQTPPYIFGVRHHGPGSARSLIRAFDALKPDCVLIEGPPDADGVIGFAGRAEMVPPVAVLVHDAERPAEAVYYPFAEFSPEWQAMRWALKAGVAVRFMDLPQSHRMAVDAERMKKLTEAMAAAAGAAKAGAGEEGDDEGTTAIDSTSPDPTDADNAAPAPAAPATAGAAPVAPPVDAPAAEVAPAAPPVADDPLGALARAAGFDDGERWWEHVVEHNRDGDLGMFTAIRDAMAELRQARDANPAPPSPRHPFDDRADEPLREAWMRRTIRAAQKEGFERIAVVCGAWHAPVLDPEQFARKDDDALLATLPKLKTAATWVPWTHDRLTFASGYGAGVRSPGWYEHLWRREGQIVESWMTRTARLLREKDVDCSSAHVIEAVRLATTLASMRGRPLADLSDIADATRSVFCFDSDVAMSLIGRELFVGDRLGELPDDVPMVPLQQDLTRLQKRLRLKPEALERVLELDLRGETDRERSRLLHRLRLLGLEWGTVQAHAGGKGTFKEAWQLRWDPGFAVRLIEAGIYGTTVEQASAAKLRELAAESGDLRALTGYLHDAMLAELGGAAAELVRQIETAAAVAADVTLLMQTLPQLASLLRYGNVRETDETLVAALVDGIVPRITAGLGGAVGSLNDEAAADMERHVRATDAALELVQNAGHTADWHACLRRILGQDTVHGLVRGRCARLLLDAGAIGVEEVAGRLSLTLSRGAEPAQGARWLEGFLSGSGLLLIHDEKLLGLIDAWVAGIDGAIFQELVPLLRRTFTTFPAGERRQIGQILSKGGGKAVGGGVVGGDPDVDAGRAERGLAVVMAILGGRL